MSENAEISIQTVSLGEGMIHVVLKDDFFFKCQMKSYFFTTKS